MGGRGWQYLCASRTLVAGMVQGMRVLAATVEDTGEQQKTVVSW
jgi:hypothetical protein